jgi:hypothetical protein
MKRKQKNKQKDILFILVSSFIVIVAWIAFNIFHILATSTIDENIQLQLTPISGTFDQKTIQQLKSRESINPLFEQQGSSSQSAVPTPSAVIITIPPIGAPTPTGVQETSLSPSPSLSGEPITPSLSPTPTSGGTIDRQGQ